MAPLLFLLGTLLLAWAALLSVKSERRRLKARRVVIVVVVVLIVSWAIGWLLDRMSRARSPGEGEIPISQSWIEKEYCAFEAGRIS